MNLVLASGSPRRRDLLSMAGIPHVVVSANIEEPPPSPNEEAGHYALRLALQKAEHVAQSYGESLVLGADTVVAHGTEIFGKPASGHDARRMLAVMRGEEHRVVTAIALVSRVETLTRTIWARVHMRRFSDSEMWSYLDTGESMDKAGAYAVQGRGAALVERVEGCYLTVVGLPLCQTVNLLRASGVAAQPRKWCSSCETQVD